MKYHEIKVKTIYVDPTVDCLFPKWWHRFIFWHKYKYPKYIIKREFIKLKDLKEV